MNTRGYTLIELTIAICILVILSAVAMLQCGKAIDRTKDATTLGNLSTLRAAIAMYSIEHDGTYPAFPPPLSQPAGYGTLLTTALVPQYLAMIPVAEPSGNHHKPSNQIGLFWNFTGNADDESNGYGAGWEYDANPHDIGQYSVGGWGAVRLMCKHVNSRGAAWSTY